MSIQPSTEFASTVSSRSSRRTVLGVALGVALGSISVPAGLAMAKPKRQAKKGRMSSAEARRKPKPNARRRPNRRPRFRVVTTTFINPAPITIPNVGAASPYPSILQVGGFRAGRILDVNVTLSGVSHTYPEEIEAILVAPNGLTAVGLMSNNGDSYDITNVTLVFDDQAASFLPFEQQIVSGTYKPTRPAAAPTPETASLRAFSGLNPNGAWRLYVADGNSGDEGSIASWALTITARVRI